MPQAIIDVLEVRAPDFGVSLIKQTPCCAIHFDYGLKVRPFFPKLVEDIGKRLDGMAQQGVDRQVLSIWADVFGYGLPRDKAIRWHRLLNEHLSRVCLGHDQHFSMLASVPLPDADAAAAELTFAVKELGAIGAVVAANVQEVNLGEIDLDDFWQTATELDVAVFIHPVQAQPSPRTAKFGLSQIAAYTFDTTLCVGSLISSGVMDRFPKLRLILSHGGGAFPYLLGRFDCMHQRMDRIGQCNVAKELPSSYVRQFYYDTILHSADTLRWLAQIASIERIVLGSDYSFPPADHAPVRSVRDAGFSGGDIVKILEENPRILFPLLAKL